MYDPIFGEIPNVQEIYESFEIASYKLTRDYDPSKVMVSISGGADSDIMIDLITRLGNDFKDKVHFVFFNTGLEYKATKDHIQYLQDKYGVKIEIEKAKKPIPVSCREYGQPFISKFVSECIERLQRHNFQWEDEPLDVLIKKYPRCKSALRWWCNDHTPSHCISQNKWLKEFMIENPPVFSISNKCCQGAKKDVAKDYKKRNEITLSMVGVRKAEGGARALIPSCFTSKENAPDEYRPLFWYTNNIKKEYETFFDVKHSRCYTEYGLKRTGCAGCPFGRNFEDELQIIEKFEPKLLKAVNKIFKDSYEYTRKYKEFVKMKNLTVDNEKENMQ